MLSRSQPKQQVRSGGRFLGKPAAAILYTRIIRPRCAVCRSPYTPTVTRRNVAVMAVAPSLPLRFCAANSASSSF